MKQYKITFYHNRKTADPVIYYREFETDKEVREWAYDFLKESSQYVRYDYQQISIDEYLNNIN